MKCLVRKISDKTFTWPLCYNLVISFFHLDFLDASDTSLAFAVFGTTQTRSFPLAIFKVSQDKPRDEYLLCFSGKIGYCFFF